LHSYNYGNIYNIENIMIKKTFLGLLCRASFKRFSTLSKNMGLLKSKVGDVFVLENGKSVEIIEYFGAKNITIKFEDGIVLKNITYNNFINGRIKNKNYPNVYGVGFIGYGVYSERNNKTIYHTWKGMIERCYCEKHLKLRSSYLGCTVDSFFLNFQNFAKWYEENYIEGFRIDKDILFKGNRVYSAETCCFVPIEINGLFVLANKSRGEYPLGVTKSKYNKYEVKASNGNRVIYLGSFNCVFEAFNTYKKHKENRIKDLAEKYKNKITEQCYDSLINWQIEIND